MANGELLAELVRAHYASEPTRFGNILNQVIAAEARAGHSQVARRLRELRDDEPLGTPIVKAVPLARPRRDLEDLIDVDYSNVDLDQLILPPSILSRVERFVLEQRRAALLTENGLKPRRKLLLFGPPGTGKTLTASALAGELKLPLARIRLEVLFSRYMGETGAALAQIFAEAARLRAVYLFDEFDALASERSSSGDVGEMRRIVGTFLQLLDSDSSNSIFIAATNSRGRIDKALFRRFDDVLEYGNPDDSARAALLRRRLGSTRFSARSLERLLEGAHRLTLAELDAAVSDARKSAVLSGAMTPDEDDLLAEIERWSARVEE